VRSEWVVTWSNVSQNEAAVVLENNRRFPPHADQSLRSAARSRL
jgi:hypothetical protein